MSHLSFIEAWFYYRVALITVLLNADTVRAANRGSLFQSNSNFRVARFHCFPPQQCHIPSCLSVCQSTWLVFRLWIHLCACLRARRPGPLISPRDSCPNKTLLSLLIPRGENDNWQFTSTSQFVHYRSWPWVLLSRLPLTAEDWIHNEGWRVQIQMI